MPDLRSLRFVTVLSLPLAIAWAQTVAPAQSGSAGTQSSAETAAPDRGLAYVPMDSWIYDALDRLAALGLVPSQITGLRPWTRAECHRQTHEAESQFQKSLGEYGPGPAIADLSEVGIEVAGLVSALRRECLAPMVCGRGGDSTHFTSTARVFVQCKWYGMPA